MLGKWIVRLIVFGLVVFGALQLLPRGDALANPPVKQEPNWDSPKTRELAQRACFDCHSNETNWPWYTKVQPVSMLLNNDITKGREKMNFSEWNPDESPKAGSIAKMIRSNKMPLPRYLMLHPEAKLTLEEQEQLILGLANTLE